MVASLHLLLVVIHTPHSDLPGWQKAILSVVGVALAVAILSGLSRLATLRTHRRDKRLRACFRGVHRAWKAQDADELAPFVAPVLGESLRQQMTELAVAGRVVHYGRPHIMGMDVVRGGEERDDDCYAEIRYTIRSWTTDVATGSVTDGKAASDKRKSLWRFVRDPARGWVADGIDTSVPAG